MTAVGIGEIYDPGIITIKPKVKGKGRPVKKISLLMVLQRLKTPRRRLYRNGHQLNGKKQASQWMTQAVQRALDRETMQYLQKVHH